MTRFRWKLAALLGIGLGGYIGLARYRGGSKPARTKRGALINDALDGFAIRLTRADFDAESDTPRIAVVEEPETELDYPTTTLYRGAA